MLIPSIDLQAGQVVQLVQGERLAIASNDLDGWIRAFTGFPIVQVIDLDAARGTGDNRSLVEYVCRRLPCQVGGGIRTPAAAEAALANGARRVIVGSALFTSTGVDVASAGAFSRAIGADAMVAAVDGRGGFVAIHGWKTTLDVSVASAVTALEPFVAAFLATLIDGEGMMGGMDMHAARALRALTSRRLIVAGGIRSRQEVDDLTALDIDAVVGMAIYTGAIDVNDFRTPAS